MDGEFRVSGFEFRRKGFACLHACLYGGDRRAPESHEDVIFGIVNAGVVLGARS